MLHYCTETQTYPPQPTPGQVQGVPGAPSRCSLNFVKFFIEPKINAKQTAEQETQTGQMG